MQRAKAQELARAKEEALNVLQLSGSIDMLRRAGFVTNEVSKSFPPIDYAIAFRRPAQTGRRVCCSTLQRSQGELSSSILQLI